MLKIVIIYILFCFCLRTTDLTIESRNLTLSQLKLRFIIGETNVVQQVCDK